MHRGQPRRRADGGGRHEHRAHLLSCISPIVVSSDQGEGAQRFIREVTDACEKEHSVVLFDSEGIALGRSTGEVRLIQIGITTLTAPLTRWHEAPSYELTSIFVVDLKSLDRSEDGAVRASLEKLLSEETVLKVGFGLLSDFHALLHFGSNEQCPGGPWLDIQRRFTRERDDHYGSEWENRRLVGLATLCTALGHEVPDKKAHQRQIFKEVLEERSLEPWCPHPPRSADIKYAAHDVACIDAVLRSLLSQCIETVSTPSRWKTKLSWACEPWERAMQRTQALLHEVRAEPGVSDQSQLHFFRNTRSRLLIHKPFDQFIAEVRAKETYPRRIMSSLTEMYDSGLKNMSLLRIAGDPDSVLLEQRLEEIREYVLTERKRR